MPLGNFISRISHNGMEQRRFSRPVHTHDDMNLTRIYRKVYAVKERLAAYCHVKILHAK